MNGIGTFIGSRTGVILNIAQMIVVVVVGYVLHWQASYSQAATLWLSIEAILLTIALQISSNQDTAEMKRMLQALTVANPDVPDEVADCG